MKREKTWNFFHRFITLLVILKLVLSNFISETEDNTSSSIALFVYYSIDFFMLIIVTVFTNFNLRNSKNIPSINKTFYTVCALMIILCLFNAQLNNKEVLKTITPLLKFVLPIFVFTSLIIYRPKRLQEKVFLITPIIVILLSVFALILFEKSKNRDNFFWPIYFSGLHTHAYVLLTVFFILFFKYRYHKSKIIKLILTTIIVISLGFGYNVRTSFIALLVFFMILIINKLYRKKEMKDIILFGILILGFSVIIFFNNYFSIEKYDYDSSGRLSVYLDRINFISNRSLIENLFGSGAGSDLMLSDTWWWEEKGSHNDYLTIIIEYGVLFLMLVIFLFFKLFQFFKGNSYVQAMLFSYLTTSVLSNGFIFRPLPSYLFFLFIAYIYLTENHKKSKLNEPTRYSYRSSI